MMRFRDYVALAFRSLRRSRLRSGLTVSALLVGATGITIMLTFVTSVKNYITDQFVQTGQVLQLAVSQDPNLTYDPAVGFGGQSIQAAPASGSGGGSSATSVMTPTLERKIAAIPHVTAVAATVVNGGGGQGIEYISLGAKRLQANFYAYEPDGVIEPPLLAGRDLGPTDTSDVLLVSQDYADALGFKNAYSKIVGQTIEFHTRQGYTGAGATLPRILPPQNQCGPNMPPGPHACGPTSGLPGLTLSARVVGVVNAKTFQRQTLFLPLSWLLAISNQAQPSNVRYTQQSGGQSCVPGQPCQPQGSNCRPGQPCQPQGGPNCAPSQPCGPRSEGIVVGGWKRMSVNDFVASSGGYASMLVKVDGLDEVAPVATAIDHLGVSAATGLDALNQQKSKANVLGLVLGALGLIALGIAALGVMNTMVMSVLDRTREIGVMRALGARRSTIRRLFSFEAASLGFLGGSLGVIIGYVFVLVARPLISRAVKSSSTTAPNFSVPIWLVVLVIGGTTAIGFISGLLPARRAARLDPVEALRYE